MYEARRTPIEELFSKKELEEQEVLAEKILKEMVKKEKQKSISDLAKQLDNGEETMRKVVITGNPPQDWVEKANEITEKLKQAPDEEARKKIIEDNDGFWRDTRIRDWLLGQFYNKCWYTEALESVSAYHVDHFRPKGRITNVDKSKEDGYWWLTFNWKNYVIAGQLINTKKSDMFPILESPRAQVSWCAAPA